MEQAREDKARGPEKAAEQEAARVREVQEVEEGGRAEGPEPERAAPVSARLAVKKHLIKWAYPAISKNVRSAEVR